MELFDIEAGKVILDPNVLYIPEFKILWDRDITEGHDIATKEIAYITFLCSFSSKNPYTAYAEKDKERKVRKDTIGREPDGLVKKAIEKYREMQETPISRLLDGALIAADVLAEYFKDAKSYGATEVMRNLKELGSTVKSLYSLKKQVQREQLEAQEVRGGNEIGMYELPDEEIEE